MQNPVRGRVLRPGRPFLGRARHSESSVAPLIVLAGLERGAQALGLCVSILNCLFPYCVSTVFSKTLFEAELRGLEGRCLRARHSESSVAPLIVLTGLEWGAQALGP